MKSQNLANYVFIFIARGWRKRLSIVSADGLLRDLGFAVSDSDILMSIWERKMIKFIFAIEKAF